MRWLWGTTFILLFLLLTDWSDGWRGSQFLYWSFAGLTGNDTAYDYLSANVDKQVQFQGVMCNDGVCLTHADWACGFTIDSLSSEYSEQYDDWYEAVDDCFDKIVKVVPVYTSLDKVRKICGRFYMQFESAGTPATKDGCRTAGGQWGVRSQLYDDEEDIVRKAGLE